MKDIVVQKFGGTSVADTDKIKNVAKAVIKEKALGNDVIVVVSAMGHTTDYLIKMAKEVLNLNKELKEKIKEFDLARYEAQIIAMQTGKNDEEKLKKAQDLYAELIENPDAKKYFETETKFNIIIADVNKIIGEAIQDVLK